MPGLRRTNGAGNVIGPNGPVAQLVEHLHGMEGVRDSSSLRSTSSGVSPWALGGFVAGEGCFSIVASAKRYSDGSPRRRFLFQVTVALRDRPMLESLRAHLGFGSITDYAQRRENWQPQCSFRITSRHAHNLATIPFGEVHLLPCAKRVQFEAWRDAFREHELLHPSRFGKGPSKCSMLDCEKPVRGRGLCRTHYYRATGY